MGIALKKIQLLKRIKINNLKLIKNNDLSVLMLYAYYCF